MFSFKAKFNEIKEKGLNHLWQEIYHKVVGMATPWRMDIIENRQHDRMVVYNWVLANHKYDVLKRLWERAPHYDPNKGGWVLSDVFNHGTGEGFVPRFHVSEKTFKESYERWKWLDDDSMADTTDFGNCEELISGDQKYHPWGLLFHNHLREVMDNAYPFVRGCAFDMGIYRTSDGNAFFDRIAMFTWNERNTAMNWKYWRNY